MAWFEDESLCSDGNEPVDSETSVKGTLGPQPFSSSQAGFISLLPWFISLISQPGPMTGDFYYAFTNLQGIPFVTSSFPRPPFSFFFTTAGLPVGFTTIVPC